MGKVRFMEINDFFPIKCGTKVDGCKHKYL